MAYQDFTTAICGTGCWGEYAFSMDTPALISDSLVRVFWNSPEDGSRRDVVYLPIAEDSVWDLVGRRLRTVSPYPLSVAAGCSDPSSIIVKLM